MPSRASTSLLQGKKRKPGKDDYVVSMPSRASTSLLQKQSFPKGRRSFKCQCPLGLVPHCYNAIATNVIRWRMCQCPLGLVPHCYHSRLLSKSICKRCQCPLGLVPHCYKKKECAFCTTEKVSMPSRASTSLLLCA